ncbi:unnamed protein product, partial [Ectocarpus sp. 12 AP-2014]
AFSPLFSPPSSLLFAFASFQGAYSTSSTLSRSIIVSHHLATPTAGSNLAVIDDLHHSFLPTLHLRDAICDTTWFVQARRKTSSVLHTAARFKTCVRPKGKSKQWDLQQ